MRTWIINGHLLDPGNVDAPKDIRLTDQTVDAVMEPGIRSPKAGDAVIDAAGLIITPGLIDVHVHLREPGFDHKETIRTGAMAAARGGFTTVCCMPNTRPVNDCASVTRWIIDQARKAGSSRVLPVGAVTVGSGGDRLADIRDMVAAGAAAVTDDGLPVVSSRIMRQAMETCKKLNIPVFSHAEDLSLARGGCMNEGPAAESLGFAGIPNVSESIMVWRDIELARLTRAHVHICHVSTAESVAAIRWAKAQDIRITCETAPHYFTLTDRAVGQGDPFFKMNPPLRSETDRQAVIQGLADGTIDLIATDHAPHSTEEKNTGFEQAPFGVIGLETAFPVSCRLVQDRIFDMRTLIQKMSKNPAALLGIDNDIKPGKMADITLIDPNREHTIDSSGFLSKSRNTPFNGMTVTGDVVMTIVGGQTVHSNRKQPLMSGR